MVAVEWVEEDRSAATTRTRMTLQTGKKYTRTDYCIIKCSTNMYRRHNIEYIMHETKVATVSDR